MRLNTLMKPWLCNARMAQGDVIRFLDRYQFLQLFLTLQLERFLNLTLLNLSKLQFRYLRLRPIGRMRHQFRARVYLAPS